MLLALLIGVSSFFNGILVVFLTRHGLTTHMLGYTFGPDIMLVSTLLANAFFLVGAVRLWRQ